MTLAELFSTRIDIEILLHAHQATRRDPFGFFVKTFTRWMIADKRWVNKTGKATFDQKDVMGSLNNARERSNEIFHRLLNLHLQLRFRPNLSTAVPVDNICNSTHSLKKPSLL